MPHHQNLHHHHARAAEPQVVETVNVYVTAPKNFAGPVAGYSTQAPDSEPSPAPKPSPAPRLPPPVVHPDAKVQPEPKNDAPPSSPPQSFYDAGDASAPPSSEPTSNVVDDGGSRAKGTPIHHPVSSPTEDSSSKPTEHKPAVGTPLRHDASSASSASDSGPTEASGSSGSSGSSYGKAGSSAAPSADPQPEHSGMSSGGKAGLAIGLIAIACIIAGIAFFFYRRKKNQAKGQKLDDEKSGYNEKNGFDQMQPGLVPRVSVRKQNGDTPRLSMRPVTNMFDDESAPKSNVGATVVNGAALAAPAPAAKAPEPQKPAEARNPFSDDAAAPVEAPKPLNISRPSTPTSQQSEKAASSPGMAAPAAAVVNGGNGTGAAPPQGPPPTNVHRVQLDFAPSMDDELELRSGMLVRLMHEYDDGWALCTRLNSDHQGVVPRSCLSKLPVKPRPPPQGHNGSPQQRPRGPPPPGVRTRPNGPPGPPGAPRMRSATNGGPPQGHPQSSAANPFGDENRARANSAGSPPKQGSSPTLGPAGLPNRKPVGAGSL